jgi:thiamine-monophosphate kinase
MMMLDEFSLIRVFLNEIRAKPCLPLGPSDDACVLGLPSNEVVLTTDSLVEGVHFTRDICSFEDVGYKAVMVNISDISAMGARPLSILISLFLPEGFDKKALLEIARGVSMACESVDCSVCGGNMSRANGGLAISITAVGVLCGDKPILRSGAKPGDLIYVSGYLGSSALGLKLLLKSSNEAMRFGFLVSAFKRPSPRLALSEALSKIKGVHAMIDISDGFLQDLSHILRQSRVGAVIECETLPVHEQALEASRLLGVDPFLEALTGGEDYELLVCIAPSFAQGIETLGLRKVGVITERENQIIVLREGKPIALPERTGFRHF